MFDWFSQPHGAPTWLGYLPHAAFYAWIAAFGGCVGSFMNVVLYRVPRGEDIVWRGSHCPECDNPIRGRHNLPVIGWLMLRGRCYDCKAKISAQYPAVELAFALAFAGVAWLVSG